MTVHTKSGRTITTFIDEVDSTRCTYMLRLCMSRDECKDILTSSETLLSGLLDGVCVRFLTGEPATARSNGRVALEWDFPSELYYPQRRRYVRVSAEGVQGLRCTLTDEQGISRAMDIVDLSLGGVRLRSAGCGDVMLSVGYTARDACLEFGSSDSFTLDLHIKNLQIAEPNGVRHLHVGCAFSDANPVLQVRLRRLVSELERMNFEQATSTILGIDSAPDSTDYTPWPTLRA